MEKKADILIVDDKPENLNFLSSMLSKNGYKVRAAINGQLAIKAAQASVPDLILLDIKMPELNGYEVCTKLKNISETKDVPIIFISALGEIEDKVRALNTGGVDYITKPFQIEEVLARVKTHLSIIELQRKLKTANIDLEKQVVELNSRNEELDAFAHTVAHDLKNPLSVLIMQVELLEECWETYPPEKVSSMLKGMNSSISKTNNIINELLLLASVRKGNVKLSPIDTGFLIDEVKIRQENLISKYKSEITILTNSWPKVLGHSQWVEEVWANYISNAIKYGGEPPKIKLGFVELDKKIRFFVTDNGMGLKSDEQKRLFKPFEQLESVQAKGHGLGLSVVRRIINKLGGEVGVESEYGKGSTFWFTLLKA